MDKNFKHTLVTVVVISIVISASLGSVMGFVAGRISSSPDWPASILGFGGSGGLAASRSSQNNQVIRVEEESSIIDVIERTRPAVVSIIVTKDLPIIERYYTRPRSNDFFEGGFEDFFGFGIPQYRQRGTEEREVGGGTGFLINSDGYILTNKHVVLDNEANYTVLMNDESKHEAKVLARDPINDLAILKIEGKDWPHLELGDSTSIKVGQKVIAIGNALGEFRNTVSTGVISGLARSIIAGGGGSGAEQLTGVIQTDASINPGNSGGPLLNIAGQVIGVNTAIVQGAQNIGFAIPINEAKSVYESVKEFGRIVRPWLGVRYVMLNEALAEENQLDIDYGALIVRGETQMDLAVLPGSPADKAGLRENDIILELEGEKIDLDNPLAKVIARYQPGDKVKLKIMSQDKEKEVEVELEEMK